MELLRINRQVMLSAAIAVVFASAARADLSVVSPAAFSGPPQITFTGILTGTEVNGLLFGGVQFAYSLGSGQVIIGVGPGTTNNLADPNLVSVGNQTGILSLTLPGLQNLFGFGYALQSTAPVPAAAIVELFNGATSVGLLVYNGVPDPQFAGGFAGIQSTMAFNRVQLAFNPSASSFAVDNIRFAATTVTPEPATFALMLTGIAGLGLLRRRRR